MKDSNIKNVRKNVDGNLGFSNQFQLQFEVLEFVCRWVATLTSERSLNVFPYAILTKIQQHKRWRAYQLKSRPLPMFGR